MSHTNTTTQRDTYYHIIMKGHSNHLLFRHPSDYKHFVDILSTKKKQYAFDLVGYCLLKDHVHFIIESTTKTTLSSILHGLSLLYTKYYQAKYNVTGPIFSGRGLSEAFHNPKELLCRLRFIHQKAKRITSSATLNYDYSSYRTYAHPEEVSLVNRNKIYSFFDRTNFNRAANLFISIHHETESQPMFDIEENLYEKVAVAKKILKEELQNYNLSYDQVQLANDYREALIIRLNQETGLNQQEIADLLSVSRHIVGRAIRINKPC